MTTLDRLHFPRRLLLCEIAAILTAGGFLGQLSAPDNRMNLFFSRLDTGALHVAIGAAGLVAALLLHGLSRFSRGRSDRWLAPWFLFWAVIVGFNFFPDLRLSLVSYLPWLNGTLYYLLIWLAGGLLTVAGYGLPQMNRLAERGWRGLVVGWPLLLLLPLRFWTANFWEVDPVRPSERGRNPNGHGAPVVIVIPDMIGYDDVFTEQGKIQDHLPGLTAFAEGATIYHQARSCGDWTETSLPGLMLQEEVERPVLENDGARWRRAGDIHGPARLAREFKQALPHQFKQAGGRAFYIGYYLPYELFMPGAWDQAFSLCFYGIRTDPPGSPWVTALWRQVAQFVAASKDPVSALAKQLDLFGPMRDRYARHLAQTIVAEGHRFIEQALSPGDLAIIHLPVPHMPFVFDANGGPGRHGRLEPAGYPDQLLYADRLVAELAATLKAAGHWEDSWVILMSDHGSHLRDWSDDPARKRHVPFLVKAPGQREPREVHQPLRLADLASIPGFLREQGAE